MPKDVEFACKKNTIDSPKNNKKLVHIKEQENSSKLGKHIN